MEVNKHLDRYYLQSKIKIMEIIYHVLAFLIALMTFSMKVTSENVYAKFIVSAVNRTVCFFVMLYSGVQIFKHFGVI
jgi:hypothetical protein